ncbi:hypothetical protein NPX13_g10762 [Xylaria arbuscula]|uniref:Uncharacterized protein n=1 Tax=Xylaria arbuscula TaxID=114810 RepID=A0A9W8N462_9PEZI|nr:hypothetical protein NPX13_g10762 [Xylaria arbuscula]
MKSADETKKRSSVPKFTSFKPNPNHAVEKAAVTGTALSRLPESQDTQASSHRHRSPIQAGVHSRSTSRPSRNSQKRPSEQRDSDQSSLYYSDTRGDNLILRYGSNDRNRIPKYRRIGASRVLGADGYMKVERLGSRDVFFIRNHHETGSLLSSDKKNLIAKGINLNSKSISIRRRKPETGATTRDYLPLSTSRKRKRDDGASGDSSMDEGPSYRSIHGKTKAHEHSDSGDEFDTDASEDELNGTAGNPVAMRSIELSRKVRQHPEDLDSWLELVDLQDSLLDLQTGSRAPTTAEMKSFADIKLSLLEQALSHSSDDDRRGTLKLKVMEEGLKVWEVKVALKRFAEVMQQYPKSFQVWKLYMNYVQTTISTCRFDEIKRLYTDKIQSLGKELANFTSVSDQIECSKQIIYVFLRLTRFLADAGYTELASAAWQGSLELNLVRSSTEPGTEWEIPSGFEEYWEGEVPRLGEANWQGWVTDLTTQEPPAPSKSKPPVLPSTRDGYKAWYIFEHHRTQNATLPTRTLDEGAEEDPFRVVMLSDFQGILLCFPASIVPHIQLQLLDAFLAFCHVPPGLQDGQSVKELAMDAFIVRSGQDVPLTRLFSRARHDSAEDQQSKAPGFCYEIQQVSLTPEVLFPSQQWYNYLGHVKDLPFESYQWTAMTLKQLAQIIRAKRLGPYALAFESIREPGNGKKRAKALLKQDPSNVDLYIGYSILEQEQKNNATARSVSLAAFSLPSISVYDRIRLVIRTAWVELADGELVKAATHLCRLDEDRPKSDDAQIPELLEASPSQILKAKQFLVTNRHYKMSSGDFAEAVIYAEGLVLLDYLTQRSGREPGSERQGDIGAAIARITQCSEDLVSRGHQQNPSHEKFLQSSAHLLYYHATHGFQNQKSSKED